MNFNIYLNGDRIRRNPIKPMANLKDRLPENVLGAFFVDSSCIDCDLCRETAPAFFRRQDDSGFSIVYRQPVTPEEIELADEARLGCPTESIGRDDAAGPMA